MVNSSNYFDHNELWKNHILMIVFKEPFWESFGVTGEFKSRLKQANHSHNVFRRLCFVSVFVAKFYSTVKNGLVCSSEGCDCSYFVGGELFMHLEREGIFMEDTAW